MPLNSVTVEVTGLRELERELNTLPEKMAKGALRTGLRRGSQLIQRRAQQTIRSLFRRRTGKLDRGIIVSTRVRSDGVRGATLLTRIGLRVSPSALSAWYGKILEFGWIVRAAISAKKALRRGISDAGRGGRKVIARPFLEPAFRTEVRNVLQLVISELRNQINKIRVKLAA